MPISALQKADLDALTKVCSLGMEHAAIALSQLLGKGVDIEVPRLVALDPAGLGERLDAQEAICLHLLILGNVRGSILILLQEESARRMLAVLLGRLSTPGVALSDLEASTLKEVGNILASACLNALSKTLNMALLPSVPTLVTGRAGAALAQVMELPPRDESILMIDTVFTIAENLCGGSIFLMPAPASLTLMLGALAAR
jgi:chemotaxis protein CheC